MSLLDDLVLSLNTAEDLLRTMPTHPQERNTVTAEIEKIVHPTIKLATRLTIQTEARRLVETDPAMLKELENTLAAASRVLRHAETLLRRLPRKR
jgi:hypothetical protein